MSLSLAIKKAYPGFTLDIELEAGEERVALLGRKLEAWRCARFRKVRFKGATQVAMGWAFL